MEDHKRDSKQILEISAKVKLLSEVTFNLKCAAFKIVDLPIQTFKSKSISIESSVVTTLDSIFHDLKRVQTLLTRHSKKYQIKTNQSFSFNNDPYEKTLSLTQNDFHLKDQTIFSKTQEREYLFKKEKDRYKKDSNFQRQASQINLQYDKSKDNLKKTKKINNFVTQSSHNRNCQTQISDICNKHQKNESNFLVPWQRDRKKSHQNINISKVSSSQYLGISQNPIIHIKNEFKKQTFKNSPPHSDISCSKVSVDWKSIHMDEQMKDKENEEFIQFIKRKRQTYQKSISKKKEKCFDTIERINSKMTEEREKSVSEGKEKGRERRKSKTQKFKKFDEEKIDKKQLKEGWLKREDNYLNVPGGEYYIKRQRQKQKEYGAEFYEGC